MKSRVLRAARVVAVCSLFAAVPLIAFEQRFMGNASAQRGSNGQSQQSPAQTAAPAQPGGQARSDSGPWEWWKDEAVKKDLGLTAKQVRDISQLFDRRVREMKPVNDEFQRQRDEQEKMARERIVDVAVFAIQVGRVDALRAELNKSRSVMFYAISKHLTAEQNTKLGEIMKQRFSGRRGGGSRW